MTVWIDVAVVEEGISHKYKINFTYIVDTSEFTLIILATTERTNNISALLTVSYNIISRSGEISITIFFALLSTSL